MASTLQLLVDGSPVDDDLYVAISSLEVEENADLPDAIQLHLPVNRTEKGDLTYVADDRLGPFANIAVVARPEGADQQCIFDGYVLSQKLHLETGTTASRLQIWGQDASWLMNLDEKTREWVDVSDADVANSIFEDYGFEPAQENSSEDSPTHTEDGHSLMQRGTDIQFLRSLARRNGKLCRVACTDRAGRRTGYFTKPDLDGDPVVTLILNRPELRTVDQLDIEWDVTRPSQVRARQALFTDSDEDGVSTETSDSGLDLLDQQGLSDFATRSMTVLLTAPAVDDGGELMLRAQSLLREADWFVRCQGEADVGRLGAILRVGAVVAIEGIGSLHSGKYFVWSVRHTLTVEAHRMRFVLVRNAVGSPPSGGLLGGLL
jgi:phage protein D